MTGLAPHPLPTDLRQMTSRKPARVVLYVQGVYCLLAGVWAVLALTRFAALIGSEAGVPLARGYGVIVAGVGVALLGLAFRREASFETARLAVAVAVVLAAADLVFVVSGAVPTVYLLDAGVQAGFVLWWGRELLPREPMLVGRIDAGLA